MPNYKTPDGKLHVLEGYDGYNPEQPHKDIHLLPADAVLITDDEAEAIQAAFILQQAKENAGILRAGAYRDEADPLFFKMQRGEATESEWLAKIAEIKKRYPKE